MTVALLLAVVVAATAPATTHAPHVATTMVAMDTRPGDAMLVTHMRSQLTDGSVVKNTFDVPFLSMANGTHARWLDKLNRALQQEALAPGSTTDPATALAALAQRVGDDGRLRGHVGASFEVLLNRGHFFALRQCVETWDGVPERRCSEHRIDTRTGKAWSWGDAIAKSQRTAFVKACNEHLQRTLPASTTTTTTATATTLTCAGLPFAVTADGALRFAVPAAPERGAVEFSLPLDVVKPFLAQTGPLGHLAATRS